MVEGVWSTPGITTCFLDEFTPRTDSAEEKVTSCKRQFADFNSHSVGTIVTNHDSYLIPAPFWEAMPNFSDGSDLPELAPIFMSPRGAKPKPSVSPEWKIRLWRARRWVEEWISGGLYTDSPEKSSKTRGQ
jgi:hypothetical protein